MRKARIVAGIGVLGCFPLLPGCGDPVPPAAQAGISIHVQEYDQMIPEHAGKDCPPSRHWVNVPYQRGRDATKQAQATSDSDPGPMAVNNQDGNVVTCKVTPKGSGFDVSGDGRGYAEDSANKKINPSNVHIRIPQIGPGDTNAPGTLSVQDHASLNVYQTSKCSFSVQGGELGIDAGKIWARVSCEDLEDSKSPGAFCQVDTGFFVFENCAK